MPPVSQYPPYSIPWFFKRFAMSSTSPTSVVISLCHASENCEKRRQGWLKSEGRTMFQTRQVWCLPLNSIGLSSQN